MDMPLKTAEDIPAHQEPAKHFVSNNTLLQVSFSIKDDTPVASMSYIGLLNEGIAGGSRAVKLEQVLKEGFTLVKH